MGKKETKVADRKAKKLSIFGLKLQPETRFKPGSNSARITIRDSGFLFGFNFQPESRFKPGSNLTKTRLGSEFGILVFFGFNLQPETRLKFNSISVRIRIRDPGRDRNESQFEAFSFDRSVNYQVIGMYGSTRSEHE